MASTTDGSTVLGRGLAVVTRRGPVFGPLDLEIPAGGLCAVVGSGHSGRSSLLLALAGRMRLSAGELWIGGRSSRDGLKALRDQVCVARVRPGVEPDEGLTVRTVERQSVVISGGLSSHDRIAAMREWLDLDDLDPKARLGDLHPRQRLLHAVALAAAQQPAVVVVDDVDHGLARADRVRAWRALDELALAGPTVIASATDAPGMSIDHTVVGL